MPTKKISVIVPVYNSETFLPKCLDSIINQTYKNLEIILIDDGSKDNSGKICDEYAKKDDRIVVVHKENAGVSSARNAGVAIATGDYIGFVDSDDWIESHMYQNLINILDNYDVDIARCSYKRDGLNISQSHIFNESKIIDLRNSREEIICNVINSKMHCYNCLILLKRNIATKIKYIEEIALGEDLIWFIELLCNINSLYYSNSQDYHYVFNENSASQSKISKVKNLRDVLTLYEQINKILNTKKILTDNIRRILATEMFYRLSSDLSLCLYFNRDKSLLKDITNDSRFYDIVKDVDFKRLSIVNKITYKLVSYKAYDVLYYYLIIRQAIRKM